MSWSIYISGPKELVVAELENARIAISHALDVATDVSNEQVVVSVSGHAYKGSDGAFAAANSFSVDGLAPPQAVVVQEEVVEKSAKDYELEF